MSKSYRDPYIAELEYKIAKLEAELRRCSDSPFYTTTYSDPGIGPTLKKEVEFIRLARSGIEYEPRLDSWHFTSEVYTPPNVYKLSYYATERMVADARSAYDVIGYLTEDIMGRFYKGLIKNV
jgi:hypothetical protein